MMNALQLQLLDASLRRRPVLSIYLALPPANGLDRRAWRIALEQLVKPVRDSLAGTTHREREGFEDAVRHLELALQGIPADAGGATWVAFVTPEGVRHSELVSLRLPAIAAWGEGIRATPYLRVLGEALPIVVVIGDAAHVDVWEYRDGTAHRLERIHAHHDAPDPAHMSAAPRPGFHAGTHGAVGRDDVQRRRREGTRRMLELTVSRVLHVARPHGWIVAGGIPHVRARLARLLTARAPGRVQAAERLDVHATAADVTAAARAAAHQLCDALDRAKVRDVIEHATPAGFGVLGSETRAMLDHARVKELYLSERFVADHLAEAEDAVRSARRQSARAIVVAGDSAALLDAEGGIAARLRYRLRGPVGDSPTAVA
jgi:hypothetical protein